MSKYIDETSEGLEDVRSIVRCIDSMARAFDETGNAKTSDMLFEISFDLSNAVRTIDNAIGEEIHRNYTVSQQSTTNMIGALLTSTTLGKESKL